jgi:hypothetical protein
VLAGGGVQRGVLTGRLALLRPCVQDRRAFVRDSLAYLLSTLALLGVMLRGVFAAWETSLLIAGYCVYLAVCVLTSRGGGSAHRGGAPGHGYAAVAPSQQQQQQQQVQLELQRVEGGWQGGGEPGGDAAGFHLASVEISPRSRLGQGLSPRPASSLARKSADGSSAALAAASPGKAAVQRNGGSLPLPPAGVEDDGELAVLVAGLPPSDALAANGGQAPRRGARSPGGGGGGSGDGRLGRVLASAALGLQEMLHTKGKSGPGMWLAMLMSPAVLLLHATMPALHTGEAAAAALPPERVSGGGAGRLSRQRRCPAAERAGSLASWRLASYCRGPGGRSRGGAAAAGPPLPCRPLHVLLRAGALPGGPPVHAAHHRPAPPPPRRAAVLAGVAGGGGGAAAPHAPRRGASQRQRRRRRRRSPAAAAARGRRWGGGRAGCGGARATRPCGTQRQPPRAADAPRRQVRGVATIGDRARRIVPQPSAAAAGRAAAAAQRGAGAAGLAAVHAVAQHSGGRARFALPGDEGGASHAAV